MKQVLCMGLCLVLCCCFWAASFASDEHGCMPDPTYAPGTPAYYCHEGGLHYSSGVYEAAILSYEAALALDSTCSNAHYGLAFTYRAMGRFDLATAHYGEVMALEPDYGQPCLSRAEIYVFLRRYDEAEADLNRYAELEGQYPVPYMKRGDFYMERQAYEQAIADYTTAMGKGIAKSALVECYLRRGEAWLRMGEADRAEADFAAALAVQH